MELVVAVQSVSQCVSSVTDGLLVGHRYFGQFHIPHTCEKFIEIRERQPSFFSFQCSYCLSAAVTLSCHAVCTGR